MGISRRDRAISSVVWAVGLLLTAEMVMAQALVEKAQLDAMFGRAEREGRVGIARKSLEVEVRPAVPGEVVITMIKGEGEETRSKPAAAGDMVVRNRCSQTGNEEYLVKADVFKDRYEGSLGGDATWRVYRPKSPPVRYVIVTAEQGAFAFTAPWGTPMQARPGDAIVRNPTDPKDTYRVAAASFACTYEIVDKPRAAP